MSIRAGAGAAVTPDDSIPQSRSTVGVSLMAKIKLDIDTDSIDQATKCEIRVLGKQKIGVVSSISLDGTILDDSFRSGVNNYADVKIKDKCNYKKNHIEKLEQEIKTFNRTADLIATAGGLVAYNAAISAPAEKRFVSLAADLPDPTGLFMGGVSLESYQSNKKRIEILKSLSFGFDSPNIGLVYNPNSAMNEDEIKDWEFQIGASGQAFSGGVNNNGDNDENAYATDFGATKIPVAIRALVISADPFFQDTKQKLIAAVNAWIAAAPDGITRYVCYPSLAYENNGGTAPTKDRATLYGPDLPTAYSLLGHIAVTVLKTGAAETAIRPPNIRRDL
jgi:hypothetical protein